MIPMDTPVKKNSKTENSQTLEKDFFQEKKKNLIFNMDSHDLPLYEDDSSADEISLTRGRGCKCRQTPHGAGFIINKNKCLRLSRANR